VEAGSNIFIVLLRVVGGDEKGTQCLGVQLGHPVSGECEYWNLALQVGSLESEIVKCGPVGLRPENICAGENQQQL
jgi:hypothetical protein